MFNLKQNISPDTTQLRKLDALLRDSVGKRSTVGITLRGQVAKIEILVDKLNYRFKIILHQQTWHDKPVVDISEEHNNQLALSNGRHLETPASKTLHVTSFPLCSTCLTHIKDYVSDAVNGFDEFYNDLTTRGLSLAEEIFAKYSMFDIKSIGIGSYGMQYVPMAKFKVHPEHFAKQFFVTTNRPDLIFNIGSDMSSNSTKLKVLHIIEHADKYSDEEVIKKSRLIAAIKLLEDL